MAVTNGLVAQSADMGALPGLYAATVADLPGGPLWARTASWRRAGLSAIVTASGRAYDEDAWRRLWEVSEELTGVRYEFAAPAVV